MQRQALMTPTRLTGTLASAIALAIASGCAPSAPAGPAVPSASPSAAAMPSGAPSSPSAAPSAIPSTTPLPAATVRGKVYDEAGQPLAAGATVEVKSLNISNPFDMTVGVKDGAYEVANVPAGVMVAITAHRDGWTARTRLETFVPDSQNAAGNTLSFGGPVAADQPYFLSDRPEIESVSPSPTDKDVDPTKLLLTLTLSEPLDAPNQRRFAKALRVFPANSAAAPGTTGTIDLNEHPDQVSAFPDAGFSGGLYTISEGTTFMGAMESVATVTWDLAGRVATLAFPAPLITDKSTAPAYQVALVSAGPSEEIHDAGGHTLGGPYTAGALLQDAFKAPYLQGADWASTHQNVSTFELARDTRAPTLASVAVLSNDTETRIALAFSEPMGAFDGKVAATGRELGAYNPSIPLTTPTTNDGVVPNGLRLTFGLAETTTQAAALGLDGTPEASADATTDTPPLNTEFGLKGARLAINPQDPHVLYVYAKAGFLPTKAHVLKVRAEGLTDPAGNMIEAKAADSNLKTATF